MPLCWSRGGRVLGTPIGGGLADRLGLLSVSLISDLFLFFFFSSRRRHTRCSRDWSSDVCSSDLARRGRGAFEKRTSFWRARGQCAFRPSGHRQWRGRAEPTQSRQVAQSARSLRDRKSVV